MTKRYDTIIVGGGPAGLAAAKHLGFFGRDVLVLDRQISPLRFNGNPIHNYPGVRATITGQALLRQFQGEAKSAGATILAAKVTDISGHFPEFSVRAENLKRSDEVKTYSARTLLLAPGVAIIHPAMDHRWENWLKIASHPHVCYYCVDCEAPLTRGKSVLLISVGSPKQALLNARLLKKFAREVNIFFPDDAYLPLPPESRVLLEQSGFRWSTGTIKAVTLTAPGIRQSLLLESGEKLQCNCFFVSTLRIPRTEFLKNLNIARNERGAILTDEQGQTNLEGVWAAGDVRPVARQIAVAVGTGNYAALMIHRKLAESET